MLHCICLLVYCCSRTVLLHLVVVERFCYMWKTWQVKYDYTPEWGVVCILSCYTPEWGVCALCCSRTVLLHLTSCWCWHCRKPTASKACEVCHSPYLYFPGIMPIHALIVQSHTKTHSAWIMLVHRAAIWDISPWPPIGQPTGLLTSAMVEIKLHLIYFIHVCYIHFMPNP